MAKNRDRQKAHKRCGISREERLQREADRVSRLQMELEDLNSQKLDMVNCFGLKDPTPLEAVNRILQPERDRIIDELRRLHAFCA